MFFFQQNNFKNFKIANQSGIHTMPKPATFHPPMHSYNVFHRRVERPSIAGIGSVPEVTLKKEGFCRVLVIAVDFLKVKSDIELTRYKIQESLLRIFGPHRSTYRHGISVTNIR